MRAVGRGTAVIFRFSGTNQGNVHVRERVMGVGAGTCQTMPVSSCTEAALWDDTDSLEVASFDPQAFSFYDEVRITADATVAGGGSPAASLDICFTPLGRAFVRITPTSGWTGLNGVPVVSVARAPNNQPIGLVRTVLLLPNGTARVGVAPAGAAP
jgi:type IV fimbrial biogenesis protein FimT